MFYGHEVIPFTPWLPQQDEQLQQWPREDAYEKHHWGSGRPARRIGPPLGPIALTGRAPVLHTGGLSVRIRLGPLVR